MDKLKRYAILISLIEHLHKKGSWCGEAHIQKAVYFLEELFNSPLNFEFMLYKYGPFSFELRNTLDHMIADRVLEIIPMEPYGPQIIPRKNVASKIASLYPSTLKSIEPFLEFIATKLGDKNAGELEVLATALYVLRNYKDQSSEDNAKKIVTFKPYISKEYAERAIVEVQRIINESKELLQKHS